MKTIKRIVPIIFAIMICSITSFAANIETKETLAAKSPKLIYENDTVNYVTNYQMSGEESMNAIVDVILDTTRHCSGYEFNHGGGYSSGNRIYLKPDIVMKVIDRENWVNTWINANVPIFIPNGITKEEAIDKAFAYLSKNYRYNNYLRDNAETAVAECDDAADAYSLLANNNGVCIAFSCAFRAIVESIPFDETGLVNWNAESHSHIQVAIVENDIHMWNAIQDETDGKWYIYDAAGGSSYCEKNMPYTLSYKLLGGEIYDCYGQKAWHY